MKKNRTIPSVFSFFLIIATLLFVGQKTSVADAAGADRMYCFNMDSNGTQGNLILVESNGCWGLLDTGHRYASTIQDANGRTIPTPQASGLSSQISMRSGRDVACYMINQLGVTHLDFIVGTHAHSDHIGGVPEIATTAFTDAEGRIRYLVDSNTTYYYKEYQHIADFEDDLAVYSNTSWHNQAYAYQAAESMRNRGANLVDVSRQQVVHGDPGNTYGDYIAFTMGGLNFRLYNVYEQNDTGNENVNSIVTVMTNGNYTIVNLSDINIDHGAIDQTSRAIGQDFGSVDVVVAGHHGYAGSNTKTMFDELQPDYVVISNGSGQNSWLYTTGDLAAAIPYAQGLFGTSFFSTALSPYAIVTDLSGNQVYVYNLESNGTLTDAFYKAIKSSKGNGWVSWVNAEETLWSYLENGKPKKNTWQKIKGRMYHFDSTGIMSTGWLDDGSGEIHYLDSNGALVIGWQMIGDHWYYFEKNYGNQVRACWQKIDGRMYYFNADGTMHVGWLDDGSGEIHYMGSDGALKTGWQEVDGIRYYFEKKYGNRLRACWQKIDGRMYYFNADGTMHVGWLDDGSGETHYMDPDGAMAVGWRIIDGVPCYFEPQFGNLQVNSGWARIDGTTYFFDENGVHTGWLDDGSGEIHYMGPDGALKTGWQEVDGIWYYFEKKYGNQVRACWQKIDGRMYYFNADGTMHVGWLDDGSGEIHYMGPDGALATGWQEIDSSWYYFDVVYGNMVRDCTIEGYYINSDGVWIPDR